MPVLERIALEFAEYEESGSREWDTLVEVSARPQWLKDLAAEAAGAAATGRRRSLGSIVARSEKKSISTNKTADGDVPGVRVSRA